MCANFLKIDFSLFAKNDNPLRIKTTAKLKLFSTDRYRFNYANVSLLFCFGPGRTFNQRLSKQDLQSLRDHVIRLKAMKQIEERY